MDKIERLCKAYLEFLRSDDYNEDQLSEYENDIFEAALEHFQGEDVWTEVNERMKG